MSRSCLRTIWRLVRARMRPMTSRARLPSAAMLSSDARASAMSGGCAASQREHAPALVIIAPSGWLTSWAIDVVSSPSVVRRDTCASSARDVCSAWSCCRSLSSASLRSVMSRTSARLKQVVALTERAAADFDREHGPVAATMPGSNVIVSPPLARSASREMECSSSAASKSRGCMPISWSRA